MSESAAKIQAPPLVEGQVVTGTLFSEPMRVETIRESGPGTWVVGLCGLNTERFRKVTLTSADLQQLRVQKPHSTPTLDSPFPVLTLCPTSLRPSTTIC
jgi:hypothetical protein